MKKAQQKLQAARPDLARVPKSVTLLGATGSIGSSTIDLLQREPGRYRVEAVTANRNAGALARLARELGARFAAVGDAEAYKELKSGLAGSGIEAAAGADALVEAAQRPADWVMAAITGAASLKPTLAAAERGATVALANKECLVCAGALFMRRAAAARATVLPVDSEHNAVFQALMSGRRDEVRRVILTASGGPFRTWSLEQLRTVTVEQALKHPTWIMGPKVTINSATLMNKGLELIEAHHLFATVARRARRHRAPAVGRPRPGRIPRRLGDRAARLAGHAHSDLPLPGLADPHGDAGAAARSRPRRGADLRGARSGPLPGPGDRAPGAGRGWGRAHHPQCGQRDRGARIRRPNGWDSRAFPPWSRRRWMRRNGAARWPSRNPSRRRSKLTIMREG